MVIFSTVRCNVDGDVGLLDDPRRLNVMWTRARLIVGDRSRDAQFEPALETRFGGLYGDCH